MRLRVTRARAQATGNPSAIPMTLSSRGLAQNGPGDVVRRRAEGQTNAEFVAPARHAIGQQAIETDAGQQDGEAGQGRTERGEQPFLGDGFIQLQRLSLDLGHGDQRGQIGQGPADGRDQ